MTATEVRPTFEFKRYTPEGFNDYPETASEALLQAQAVLLEEERWVSGEWFQNHHPELDPDDPFCNDWKVCAAGAVVTVTIGMARQLTTVETDWDNYIAEDGYKFVVCDIPKSEQKWGFTWEHLQTTADKKLYEDAIEFLRMGAVLTTERTWYDVPGFNDNSETTRQDVIAAFSRGIALAVKAETNAKVQAQVTEHLGKIFANNS